MAYYKPGSPDGELAYTSTTFTIKSFLRGDVNNDRSKMSETPDTGINIGDVIFILNYLFSNGPPPKCLKSADVNDDGRINIADAIYLLKYLFGGGDPPAEPFPEIGLDPTPDKLMC